MFKYAKSTDSWKKVYGELKQAKFTIYSDIKVLMDIALIIVIERESPYGAF